ncbi:MAG: hypothetical protein IJQ17_05990 [Oscillospiraceae bacterium]|nr:hypothetical protein [Oscillospiraceae bacterium]
MVKGTSHRVIVVQSPDPQVFEQAIFILHGDGGGVTSRQAVEQAERIARSYARSHQLPRPRRRLPGAVWALAGAAAIGAVWLLLTLL